jgi:CHAT domain-containing protein
VLALAILMAVLSSPHLYAQQNLNLFAAAASTPSYKERLKTLEARKQRQQDLGFTAEAEQTAQEIARVRQQHHQQCQKVWDLVGRQPTSVKDALRNVKQAQELLKGGRLVSDCGRGPDDDRDPDDVDIPGAYSTEEMIRGQLESEDPAARTPLFVEPVLSTGSDADVPSPLMAGADEFVNRASNTRRGPATETFLKTFAAMRESRGDLTRATTMLEGALTGLEGDPVSTLFLLDFLRQLDQSRGDSAGALGRIKTQLAVTQARYGADSPRLCHPLWQSIPPLLDTGRPDDALAAAQRCLRLLSGRADDSLTYASALNNLGLVYQRTGLVQQAVGAYERAMAILERIPDSIATLSTEGTRQPAHLNVRANLGLAYWQSGDVTRAAQQFETARARMLKEGQSFVSERGAVTALAKLGAEVDALVSLERQVATRQAGASPALALPLVLERKGLALEEKATAVRTFARDAGELQEYRSLLGYRARLARGTPLQTSDLGFSDRQVGQVDLQIQILEYEARQHARRAATVATTFDSANQKEMREYGMALSKEVERLTEESRKKKRKDDRSETEIDMGLYRQAQANVAPKFKGVMAQQQAMFLGTREELLARIQKRLPESAALLEMVRYRPMNVTATTGTERWQAARYGAYLVRRTGRPTFLDFGTADSIDALVAEFRRMLAQPRGTLAHELGRRLDALLMQPVRASLGGARTIYLSPDGALNLVPFAALVDEQDRYLLETFTFNYVSTGRDLTRPTSQAVAATAPVVIGDPAFDAAADQAGTQTGPDATRGLRGQSFGRLPGTAAEARNIANLLGKVTVFTGSQATETALKSVESPRVLHVATHGFFLADQDLSTTLSSAVADLEDPMLRSGLVLSGVNIGKSGNDDGVLTALEAAGLALWGTQLVVLSACETGVGEVKTGEGVFGLRRAFMVAGAETLVMSLWQVEDTATQRLMTEFYRRLAQGEDRSQALRQASLSLMQDAAYRHPFFWASFIAAGETGPLHR